MMIKTYEEFIARVQSVGMMSFYGKKVPGIPSLGEETEESQWHTGELNTDPWVWKDRAPEEKKLAFGCLFGGNKGFIAEELYPYFYAACKPEEPVEELYYQGLISQTTHRVYELLEEYGSLTTSQIRKHMGVSKKNGASKVESAIKELQRYFIITVSGSEQRRNAKGEPYGWFINRYTFVENWAPQEWLEEAEDLTREEAREYILDCVAELDSQVDRNRVEKALFGKL